MINLIPNQEKKKMVKDFYYRFAILSVVMLCVSAFVALLALLPAYFLSDSKSDVASQKLEAQKNQPVLSNEEISTAVRDINDKLYLIEAAQKNRFLVSEKVIHAVFLRKIPGVKITQIAYENNTQSGRKVSIRGTAPSREILRSFRQALEEDASFKAVDLPISNFVKGSNIQFSLTLIPA